MLSSKLLLTHRLITLQIMSYILRSLLYDYIRVFKNATEKFRMVVGEVYGSARKIVPVVGVASRGSYGASKASAYPLVGRETVWHAWEFAVLAEHQRLPAGFTSCMRAIRFPYLQGDTPTPLTPRNSHEKRRRPPGLFLWNFRTPPQPPCQICR